MPQDPRIELYVAIRHGQRVAALSFRAREFKVGRDTVGKALALPFPKPRKPLPLCGNAVSGGRPGRRRSCAPSSALPSRRFNPSADRGLGGRVALTKRVAADADGLQDLGADSGRPAGQRNRRGSPDLRPGRDSQTR